MTPYEPISDISADDDLKFLESNRVRIRALGTIVGTTAGLVVTVSLAIIAYVYKADAANTSAVSEEGRITLFVAVGLAALALSSAVVGFRVAAPYTAHSKAHLVPIVRKQYAREHAWIDAGAVLVFLAIIAATVGTFQFVSIAQPKPGPPNPTPTAVVNTTP